MPTLTFSTFAYGNKAQVKNDNSQIAKIEVKFSIFGIYKYFVETFYVAHYLTLFVIIIKIGKKFV